MLCKIAVSNWVANKMANTSVCAVGFVPVTPKTSGYGDLSMPASRLHCDLAPKLRFNGLSVSQVRIPSHHRLSCLAEINPSSATMATLEGGSDDSDVVPIPKVAIDQDSDPNATVVEVTFGDRLGALLDTMEALRDLGLNVVKANVFLDSSGKHNTFSITRADTGRKVDDPEALEQIRLTIINNLLKYHPESSAQLAMGEAFGIVPPKEKPDVDISTRIHIYDDGPNRRFYLQVNHQNTNFWVPFMHLAGLFGRNQSDGTVLSKCFLKHVDDIILWRLLGSIRLRRWCAPLTCTICQ